MVKNMFYIGLNVNLKEVIIILLERFGNLPLPTFFLSVTNCTCSTYKIKIKHFPHKTTDITVPTLVTAIKEVRRQQLVQANPFSEKVLCYFLSPPRSTNTTLCVTNPVTFTVPCVIIHKERVVRKWFRWTVRSRYPIKV